MLALVLVIASSIAAISQSKAVAQSTERRMTLTQGYMVLSFNGKSGTLPLDFVAEMDYAIDSVYVWDAASQSWDTWTASKGSQGLNSLNRGDTMMVYVPVSKQVTFRPADLVSTNHEEGILRLPSGYSLHVFGGSSPEPLTDFLGYQAASIPVVFRWDRCAQQWNYFLPGRQPLSRMSIPWFDVLNPGDPFFIYNISSEAIGLALGTAGANAATKTSTPTRRLSWANLRISSASLDLGLVERYIFEITNEVRREACVRELSRDTDVDAIARAHSRDMAERGYYAHNNPDGQDPSARAIAAGYPCSVSENINIDPTYSLIQNRFYDEESLARVLVDDFMRSPGHRRNKLDAKHDRMGVGVYIGRSEEGWEHVWVTENYSGCHSRRLGSADLDMSLVERYIFDITNELRRENGVGRLLRDSDLDAIARAHSRDMVERDFFEHDNPDGLDPTARAKAAGYACGVGSYISYQSTWNSDQESFHDEESLARKIVASQNRQGWVINERYGRVGVGVFLGRQSSGWETVWVTENYTGARFCT